MRHDNLTEEELDLLRDELLTELSSDHLKKVRSMSENLKRQIRFHKSKEEAKAGGLYSKASLNRNTILKLEKKNKQQANCCQKWIWAIVEIDNQLTAGK